MDDTSRSIIRNVKGPGTRWTLFTEIARQIGDLADMANHSQTRRYPVFAGIRKRSKKIEMTWARVESAVREWRIDAWYSQNQH